MPSSQLSYQSIPVFNIYLTLSDSNHRNKVPINKNENNTLASLSSKNINSIRQTTEVYLTTVLDQEIDAALNFQQIALV